MSEVCIDSNKKPCPICGLMIRDILKHLRIRHDIENTEQLTQYVNQMERKNKKKKEFAEYVAKLKKKIQSGEIAHEEYRRLVTQWTRGNNHE